MINPHPRPQPVDDLIEAWERWDRAALAMGERKRTTRELPTALTLEREARAKEDAAKALGFTLADFAEVNHRRHAGESIAAAIRSTLAGRP